MPYRIKLLILLGVIATILLYVGWLTARAEAQDAMCGKHADLAAELAKRYAEEPIGMGLSNNGSLFELFASADGKTFSIAVSLPNGMSCLVGAGEGWEELKPLPRGSRT